MIDGGQKMSLMGSGITQTINDRQQSQPVRSFLQHRHTQHTRPMANHEIHLLRRDRFGGANEVPCVLSSLIIDNDDPPAVLEGIESRI